MKFDGTPSKKKFRGFNFYIQCNEKLSQNNRKTLLRTSTIHLSEVESKLMVKEERKLTKLVFNLDSNLSDWELLDQWNMMYDNFGYLMSEFKKKWEDKSSNNDWKNNGGNDWKNNGSNGGWGEDNAWGAGKSDDGDWGAKKDWGRGW